MSLNVGNLIATLGLDSKGFSTGIATAQAQTGTFASGFASKMSALAVPIAAVGAAAAAAATYAVSKFADFEQGMNEVFTLVPQASAEMRDKMTADVKAFSKEFGALPDTVVPALYQAISAGVPQDNVFSFLETAQKAAVGGVTDITTAVDGLTSVVNAYGAEVLNAEEASDIMFQTAKIGKTDFGEMAQSLYNVIPTASALKVPFGEVGAALAAITAQGTPTSVATTQMRQMFVELSKAGSKTAETFQSLAGTSFRDFVAGGGTVQDALQLLEQHASDTGVGINDLFGSVEAGNAALSLTGRGTDAFSSALAGMAGAAGATETAYEEMEGGINRQLEKIKAEISVIILDLAGALVPLVNDCILPALRAVVGGIQAVMSWFGEASGAPNPLIDTIKNALIPAIEFFQEKLAYLTDWWQENSPVFIAAWNNIAAAIQWVIETVIVPVVEWAWPYIETIISGALDVILNVAKLFASILAGDWQSAGDALVDISKGTMEILNGIMAAGWDAIASGIETVGNGILGFIYGLMSDIVQYVEDQVNKVIDIINGMISSIESVTSAVGITLPRLSHISLNADKIVAPTLKIARWSETAAGQAISAYTAKDETSGATDSSGNEEDIDAEFEEQEQDNTSLLDQVATAPNVVVSSPEITPAAVEAPAVTVPETPAATTATEAAATTAAATTIEGPIDVDVINWSEMPKLPTLDTPLPMTLANWSEMPTITLPEIALPEVVTAQATTATTDIFPRLRDYLNAYTGETRVVVELDGNVIGETLFRTWNRRTGGALNG